MRLTWVRILTHACAALVTVTFAAAGSGEASARDSAPWRGYPWSSDTWPACSSPSTSPGARLAADDRRTVIVLGDSLIRDARSQITRRLQRKGFEPVFVCFGGKGLEWGTDQLAVMAERGIRPRCLVVNLGVNDLKGTTENGLADAVGVGTVVERLRTLVHAADTIDHVLLLDLAADIGRAPATLAKVEDASRAIRAAAQETPGVTVLPWAATAAGIAVAHGPDGVHDSPSARLARARLIAAGVDRHCSVSQATDTSS